MRKKRAIVFDDDAVILRLYTDLFKSLDYEVLSFIEPVICPVYGENAERCNQCEPCADIMITDNHMPRMTGLDLLRAQRARGCKLTILNKALITGFEDDDVVQQAQELGCLLHRKPMNISLLLNWIAECEQRMDLAQPLAARPSGAEMQTGRT